MKGQFLKICFLTIFGFGLLYSCNDEKQEEKKIDTPEIVFNKEGIVFLIDAGTGDTIQTLDTELAETEYEKQTGLMYRESMEDNQSMLFVYDTEAPRSFYMKNTYFSLDIMYFGADSTLVSVQKNAVPRDETSLPSEGPAQFILEVNGGLTDQWGFEKGDKFSFKKTE